MKIKIISKNRILSADKETKAFMRGFDMACLLIFNHIYYKLQKLTASDKDTLNFIERQISFYGGKILK